MANGTKQSVRAEINNFVQGLITEASPLNYPANASVSEENFELNRDGTRDRRRGMDFETPFGLVETNQDTSGYPDNYGDSTYIWKSVGGNGGIEFLIIQFRNSLYFYNNLENNISADGFVDFLTIPEFPTDTRFSFATVDGNLVAVAGVDTVCVVEFAEPDVFTYTLKRIRVRDVWGLEINGFGVNDQYETDDTWRGSATTPEKQIYNLQNQSWGIPRRNFVLSLIDPTGSTAILRDPLQYFYDTHVNSYPANGETVYGGLQFQSGSATDVPSERMFPTMYDDVKGLGVKAAKGYFIIDLLRRGQSRLEESTRNRQIYPQIVRWLTATNSDFTPGGAKIARGFAGRVFYAGFEGTVIDPDRRSPTLSSYVVFSQVVRNVKDITNCYQEGDPTSRDNTDIIDTDGGFIKVSGVDQIIGLRPLGNSLIVFGTNGVWEIQGGSDFGFSATNYKVTKLSAVGAFSETSIVEEVGRLFFWAQDGIYVISPDQFGSNTVRSITQTTIQTLYDDIPTTAKERATGVYDLFSKKIRWVYNTGAPFTSTSNCRELVLDVVLNAFYENKIANLDNRVEVINCFASSPFTVGSADQEVLVGADLVLVGVDSVVVNQPVRESGLQGIKYVTLFDNDLSQLEITISLYNNVSFLDWEKVDDVGVDAKAFLLTGARTAGDSAIDKQIPYLFMHFRRTENGFDINGDIINQSGCLMRSQWDFANTAASFKFGPLVQAYRYNNPHLITDLTYDSGFELITTKNKLRGRGKAFSLYLETEPLKDCRIVGWNIVLNGNSIA